jgi:predicted esterase
MNSNATDRACLALVALAAALVAMTPSIGTEADVLPIAGTSARVTFDHYSPLAKSTEMVRRTLSPIAADRVLGYLRDQSQQLPEQSIDLSREHFALYVPRGDAPADGYGLLVFIAPWDDGSVPSDWRQALDRHHLIYVAADRAGNDYNMLWRRVPLALHAYENVAARYHIDPERIYISGMSGGSRTAMRVALSYPDVFHGAILNAGSDPFGNAGIAVPPAELFREFQERSRVVLVSGTEDLDIDERDAGMLDSANRLCVQGISTQPMLHIGHALMRGSMLDHAISAIERDDSANATQQVSALEACRAKVAAEITQGLQQVRVSLAQGDKVGAGHALSRLDDRFGGLAAPESSALARQLTAK